MAKQFLDKTGLATFLTQLKGLFATPEAVAKVEEDTNTYILNIDYDSTLAFDTTEIITESEEAV